MQIDKISNFLSGNQYIQISEASWFVTNKTGVWFEESDVILEVNLDGSCENWFTSNSKKWALITNQSLCFRDTSKQQVVTWAQIMSGVTNNSGTQDTEIAQFLIKYPSLGQIVSWGVVTINQQRLTWVESDVKAMTQDRQIIDALVDWVSSITTMMLIPLWFMTIFFALIITIVLFIWLVIYSLIARAIAGIMKYDIDFEQAFSLSWLPWILVKVVGTMAGFDWYLRILIWIIIVVGLIYYYKQNKEKENI
jgi:hypothetical protein